MTQTYSPVNPEEPNGDDDHDESSEESLTTIWVLLLIHFFGAALCVPALPMLVLEVFNRKSKESLSVHLPMIL